MDKVQDIKINYEELLSVHSEMKDQEVDKY
jgi:hypothetical protein